MICTSIGNIPYEDAVSIASGAEMIEIRADLADFTDEELKNLISLTKCSLFTCRPGKIIDEERLRLFSFACKSGVDYIDAEIENPPEFNAELRNLAQSHELNLVISYHNFEMTPPLTDLKEILQSCYDAGADVAKIACMVNTTDDLNSLMSLYKLDGRKVILGMGEKGMISRVAARVFGAEFTFASSGRENSTAPGQLTVDELNDIFRILKIN